MSTEFGARSAWLQLVDLIGRGRAAATPDAMVQLRAMRPGIATAVRGQSARALAFAQPPAPLVRLFAEDILPIAAPVLRTAQLTSDEWVALLPELTPATRAVLRHRRDLPPSVRVALESFGPSDFILPETPVGILLDAPVMATDAALPIDADVFSTPPLIVLPETSFVSLATVAAGLPVVVEAMRRRAATFGVAPVTPKIPSLAASPENAPNPGVGGTFEIADLVARIDAFQREREEVGAAASATTPLRAANLSAVAQTAQSFQFETDAGGVVRWVAGIAREALIGISIGKDIAGPFARVDGAVAGAFRRRAPFNDARLEIGGGSGATGSWQISAMPAFDPANGRFTGYRGIARRPRVDERARRTPRRDSTAADSLRQLVHELRTPTTAIVGFAEMIEGELLGPVSLAYRSQASAIQSSAMALLAAIDDLDMAARLESDALDLRADLVKAAPLIDRIALELAPLVALRGVTLQIDVADDVDIKGDERAVDRLFSRLLAALVSAGSAGETIAVRLTVNKDTAITRLDRPSALAPFPGEALLALDAEAEAEQGAPLLGTGFAIRLARNLAIELGGSLLIEDAALTLRLPAALNHQMDQAVVN